MADPFAVSPAGRPELQEIWHSLGSYSGFPEPFVAARSVSHARWSAAYYRQLIREDIRDLTDVRSVTAMETLFHLLPSRVGSGQSLVRLGYGARSLGFSRIGQELAGPVRTFLSYRQHWTLDDKGRAGHRERAEVLSLRCSAHQGWGRPV